MHSNPPRLLATVLAVALLAIAAVAGATTAQPSEAPSAEFDGDLTVTNGANQRITGTSTLDAGTEIIVEIRGPDDYREPERATVREDGSFAASFDLRKLEPGDEYTAEILAKNETGRWVRINDEVTGTVAAAPNGSFTYDGDTMLVANTSEATISGETSLDAGTEVTVSLRSSSGSSAPFLKTNTVTVAENGTFSATFDLYGIPAGTQFVAGARANGTDLAEVEGRVVDELPPETTTTTTESTETTNGEGQPGFGVAAALVALAGAALVARRD